MQKFTGKSGKEWGVDLTLGVAQQIRKNLPDYDLFAMQENPHKFQKLLTDPFELAAFLVVVLDGQFSGQKTNDMELAEDLDAAAVNAARKAVREEFMGFIPAERKAGTSQLLDTAASIESELMQAQAEGLKNGGIVDNAREMIRQRMENLSATLISAGSPSSATPQS